MTHHHWYQKPEGTHDKRRTALLRDDLKGCFTSCLTLAQTISVGARNDCALRFYHEDLANKLYQMIAQNEESNGLFVNRSFFFEQAKRTGFHHFGDKERRLQELN